MESLNSEFKGLEKFAACLANLPNIMPRLKTMNTDSKESKITKKLKQRKRSS